MQESTANAACPAARPAAYLAAHMAALLCPVLSCPQKAIAGNNVHAYFCNPLIKQT